MNKLLSLFAAALLAGCGVSEADVDLGGADDTDQLTEELGSHVPSYVTARRDYRRCMAPLCGGYWVQDLNRLHPTERYVSGLDFSQANLDDATQALVRDGASGELVLRGKLGAQEAQFGTRAFLVLEAWRGMPGVQPAAGERTYRVSALDLQCFAAPCPSLRARRVNYATTTDAHGVMTHRAALTKQVDQEWMGGRVERHDALVAARFVYGNTYAAGTERILDASQVYVRLPNKNGPCPLMPLLRCPAGQVHAWSRTADLCLLPKGCVTPTLCMSSPPACPDGYTLASWAGGPNACPAFACDPSFIVGEAQP